MATNLLHKKRFTRLARNDWVSGGGWITKGILTEQGDIIYASGVATPAALPHGTAGQVLKSGGHGANPAWQAVGAPAAHKGTHENTGTDEISVAGLSGQLADLQLPVDHTHQSSGSGVGGKLDHGAALTGLTDDDHTQYQKENEKDVANGYAGLNASTRMTKGVDTTDDVIIDLATKGLVLKDTQVPNPHYWRVTIDNAGTLETTDLGITKP